MQVEFQTVDVFTDRRFGGNPLAVVLDASTLTAGEMQSIAAEFNLAETTFVLPPRDKMHTAEVRIFTPRAELPFAGHPNIGTAFVLATRAAHEGAPLREPLVFEEKAGLVRIDLIRDGGAIVGARLAAPQPLKRGEDIPAEVVAAACSLAPDDIATENHLPCIASCGIPLVFTELKSRAALAGAQPRTEVFARDLKADRATGVLLYVREQSHDVDIQARMFAPLYGVPEDPATGAANLALVTLGTILHACGAWIQASEYYRRSLDIDGPDPRTLFNLGMCERACGNPRDAISAFARAIELDPDFEPAQRRYREAKIATGGQSGV